MKLLKTLLMLVCLSLLGVSQVALAERAGSVTEVQLDPLKLGMTEKRARQLLASRNFTETSPGDFYRKDGEGRFTRMQYGAEQGQLTLVRLYLESSTDYSSALQGYLNRINTTLGAPDEHKAGQDKRDPLVHDIYVDFGKDPARLVLQLARGKDRFAALMTLQGPSPEQARTGSVSDIDLMGFRLGLNQDEMTRLAKSLGMSPSNSSYYYSSGQPPFSIRWTMGQSGAQAITLTYKIGHQDARAVPEVRAMIETIEASMGADDKGQALTGPQRRYRFSDGDDRSAPTLEVTLMAGEAHFMLKGDANYRPRVMPPLEAIELNQDIVAQAKGAMTAQAALPEPISIDEAAVAGIRLGMSKAQVVAAAKAAGYEQRREDAFQRTTADAYHNVNIKYGATGVIKVTEQVTPNAAFDIEAEKQDFLASYGRPNQAMNESPIEFSGLFREDSDAMRMELQVTVTAQQKNLRLEQRDR